MQSSASGIETASATITETVKPFAITIPICYDFTCSTKEMITLNENHWKSLVAAFGRQPTNAEEERLAIQRAIARMEQLSGFHTPTFRDMARNFDSKDNPVFGLPGQMDCIDESINTTTYLKLFENQNLLKYHRVLPRAYRRALLNQHWAGQVEDIITGKRYIVDSWFRDNGQPPYVVSSDVWHDISVFNRSEQLTQSGNKLPVEQKQR
ncbi:MAG: hypothetical protein DHS20C01_01560 [marine bacterium B5-7]|nr:MAG: hypothetical protein DHS20C01_01560 [marine bacterium B5-7]